MRWSWPTDLAKAKARAVKERERAAHQNYGFEYVEPRLLILPRKSRVSGQWRWLEKTAFFKQRNYFTNEDRSYAYYNMHCWPEEILDEIFARHDHYYLPYLNAKRERDRWYGATEEFISMLREIAAAQGEDVVAQLERRLSEIDPKVRYVLQYGDVQPKMFKSQQ